MMRSGQAMVETVLAVLVITFLFFGLFTLSRLLETKILVQHAAMRVARARAVGCNSFMCLKAGRISVIPAAGKRLRPGPHDERKDISETALAHMYMRTPDASYAAGLLEYEHWTGFEVHPGDGGVSTAKMRTDVFKSVTSEAVVDVFPVYLNDCGL